MASLPHEALSGLFDDLAHLRQFVRVDVGNKGNKGRGCSLEFRSSGSSGDVVLNSPSAFSAGAFRCPILLRAGLAGRQHAGKQRF